MVGEKAHLAWVVTMSNSEEINPVALTIAELCLAGAISQSVSGKFINKL